MDSPKKKHQGKKTHTNPENLYDLDGTHSVKSINAKPRGDNLYGGTPGAPAFKVGKKTKQRDQSATASIVVDSDNDGASNLSDSSDDISTLSKEELIKRPRNAKVSSQPKGSAPDYRSRALRSGTTLNLEDSSSSDSSSSSSSSTSSAESDGSTSGAGSG